MDRAAAHYSSINARVIAVQTRDSLHYPRVFVARIGIDIDHYTTLVSCGDTHGRHGFAVAKYERRADPCVLEKRLEIVSVEHNVCSHAAAIDIRSSLPTDSRDRR